MGINIGICETEAKNALCRELKQTYHKVKLDDIKGFEDAVSYDEFVPLDEAKKIFPDWEGFMKRNRINAETDAIYLDKIKKEDDLELLKKESKRVSTGWIEIGRASCRERV